jgi:asparagine synthase (glutamine-hydrolysing)
MCGILGFFDLRDSPPVEKPRFEAALDMLEHRGPDDRGTFIERSVGLGVRRLSIIDPAGGRQPVYSEDKSVVAAYNGEIYNHRELRSQLISLGHRFISRVDTEVLVHGYEQWGFEKLLGLLRGMFAFVLYDRKSSRLFLARDRMGIKPLYYAESGGRLYFSSEIRPLLFLSRVPAQMNLDVLGAYLQVGFVPGPATMFRNVTKLPPAHYLSAGNAIKKIVCYWRLEYGSRFKRLSDEQSAAQFRDHIREAVKNHLLSDVPVGALLSGGVDSATNASFSQQNMRGRLKTISIGFEQDAFDEAREAAECAKALGTEHHQVTFKKELMDDYPSVLAAMEEPIAQGPFMAMHRLFGKCRELGLKVVLTGEGADELLGGYGWNWGIQNGNPGPNILRAPGRIGSRPFGRILLRIHDREREKRFKHTGKPLHVFYRDQIRRMEPDTIIRLLSSDLKSAQTDEVFNSWASHVETCGNTASFNKLLWLQSRTRMPDFVNLMVERMSMAHSVEARPLFMDHCIWEYCAQLPPHLKVRGNPPGCIEKFLLREAGRGIVPEPSRTRRKKPLQVPHAYWLSDEKLPEWAAEALSDSALKSVGLFDPVAVGQLHNQLRVGNTRLSSIIMAVLSVQVWCSVFL